MSEKSAFFSCVFMSLYILLIYTGIVRIDDASFEGIPQRAAVVAGLFYPEDSLELKKQVDSFIRQTSKKRTDALAIISPHAAFPYSGQIQAEAFSAVGGRSISRVVVLAPWHRGNSNVVFMPESSVFETPLGFCEVDVPALNSLALASKYFNFNDIPHLEEHSVELQLPFIQRVLPDAKIVPLLFGHTNQACRESVAQALNAVFSDSLGQTLFVVSTDLCTAETEASARKNSEESVERISRNDSASLIRRFGAHSQDICGLAGLDSLLSCDFMRGRRTVLLAMGDSCELQREDDPQDEASAERIVSYGAIAFY
jgi:MEMO1 family protein